MLCDYLMNLLLIVIRTECTLAVSPKSTLHHSVSGYMFVNEIADHRASAFPSTASDPNLRASDVL